MHGSTTPTKLEGSIAGFIPLKSCGEKCRGKGWGVCKKALANAEDIIPFLNTGSQRFLRGAGATTLCKGEGGGGGWGGGS